jgi:hypothetical protein
MESLRERRAQALLRPSSSPRISVRKKLQQPEESLVGSRPRANPSVRWLLLSQFESGNGEMMPF